MGSSLTRRRRANSTTPPTAVKVVLLGDMDVGKTSLANVFVHNLFQEVTSSSVGGHVMTKTLKNPRVILQIWDTAAREKFRHKLSDLTKGTDSAILIYDLGNRESFLSIRDFWLDYVKASTSEDLVKVLVANKCDCANRQVQEDEGRSLAERHGMLFVETSAKLRINVDKLFTDSATAALEAIHQPSSLEDCPRIRLFEYEKDRRNFCVISH